MHFGGGQAFTSCGIFAWNAIAARLLPERHELATAKSVERIRAKLLCEVILQATDDGGGHYDMTSDAETEPATDYDCMSDGASSEMEVNDNVPEPVEISNDTSNSCGSVETPNPSDHPKTSNQNHSVFTEPLTRKSSSIRQALQTPCDDDNDEPTGLLKYFKKATEEERHYQTARELEKLKTTSETVLHEEAITAEKRKVQKRERARERKQKERQRKKDVDIAAGLRSPGGTKRKVSPMCIR